MGLGPLWFNVILAIVFICFNALNSQHAFTLAAGTSGWSSTKKLAIRCANSSSTETQMLRLRCSEKVRELFYHGYNNYLDHGVSHHIRS